MDDPLLRISRTQTNGSVELSVEGEIDMSSVPKLKSVLDQTLAGRPALVVVDGRGLSFCDVAGLNCLVAAAFDAGSFGGRLVVRNANRSLTRLLQITSLDSMLLEPHRPVSDAESDG